MGVRPRRGGARPPPLGLPRQPLHLALRGPARGRRAGRGGHRDARAHPRAAGAAGPGGRAGRLRREAPRADRPRGERPGRRGRRGRAGADGRPPADLPSRRAGGEGDRQRGAAGAGLLPLRQPGEPRDRASRRERPLEPGAPRHLGDAPPGRRAPPRGLGERRELPPAGGGGRGVRAHPVPVGDPGSPAPELARPAQDAQDDRDRVRADGGVRRHGDRAQGDDLRQGADPPHRDLRRVHPGAVRRHPHPEGARHRAAAGRVRALRPGRARPRARPRRTAAPARWWWRCSRP